MSCAAPITVGFTQADIYDYARSVRAHLTDLGPSVVSELTGGLEGDLSEALHDPGTADRGSLAEIFGPPSEYASELRAAAGLPITVTDAPRGRRAKQKARAKRRKPEFGRVRAGWQRAWAPVIETEEWRRFRSWRQELAPAWWVIRGWLVGSFLATALRGSGAPSLIPRFGLGLLLTLAMTVLSVQWGRDRWFIWPWLRRIVPLLSAFALLFGLIFAANGADPNLRSGRDARYWAGFNAGSAAALRDQTGIWVGGNRVQDIFAYDADGEPIPVVQLFDQDGRPVTLSLEGGGGFYDDALSQFWQPLPRRSADGREWWNTFPSLLAPEQDIRFDEFDRPVGLTPGRQLREPQWPFLRASRVDVFTPALHAPVQIDD